MTSALRAYSEHEQYYSEQELNIIRNLAIPRHVAIIPDGNRRWAKMHNQAVDLGHSKGAEVLITIVKAAKQLGIQTLTVFGFSTENWKRPLHEVDTLMNIINRYLIKNTPILLEQNVRLDCIGNTSRLPKFLNDTIISAKEQTKHCDEFELVLALNYGGRDELVRVIRKMIKDAHDEKLSYDDVKEDIIGRYLDTAKWPDPDLLIRTSGEKRFSNFLLWQTAYTEIYLESDPWPSFTPHHLFEAIVDYAKRDRRKGGGAFEHRL